MLQFVGWTHVLLLFFFYLICDETIVLLRVFLGIWLERPKTEFEIKRLLILKYGIFIEKTSPNDMALSLPTPIRDMMIIKKY